MGLSTFFFQSFRLTETGFGKKGEYATYLKGYMKNVVKKLEEAGKNDQVEEFKKNIQPYISELLKEWKDLMFFVGECLRTIYALSTCTMLPSSLIRKKIARKKLDKNTRKTEEFQRK